MVLCKKEISGCGKVQVGTLTCHPETLDCVERQLTLDCSFLYFHSDMLRAGIYICLVNEEAYEGDERMRFLHVAGGTASRAEML